ncbi:MAG: hypothetical protein IPK93_02610 [Solirubrobacterales bacterium]|nr:hypothetical protein [Solirubrobacterales bacterium]
MGTRLTLLACAAALIISGCGGSDSGPDPANDKTAEIINARKYKKRLERQQAARERKQAKLKAKAAAKAGASVGTASSSNIDSMLANLPGQGGLVVGAPGGDGTRLGNASALSSTSAWSTIKVPISERVLADAGGHGGISSTQQSNINAAITLSDNDAAAALFSDLKASHGGLGGASTAVGEMLRQAGDEQTVVSTQGRDSFTTYGQTNWSLEEQNKYMAALAGGCISDSASRNYLLNEMSQVTSDTWGLGSAGVPAKWKGGWGPGPDGKYLVRQMGTMDIGGEEAVVTIAAISDDGSFESGQAMATSIASWAATHLKGKVPASTPC